MNLNAPQPPPTTTDSPAVWPLIIADLKASGHPARERLATIAEERHVFGLKKYGTALQVENSREPLVDALQEALDAMAYTRQHFERVRNSKPSGMGSGLFEREVAAYNLHRRAVQFALAILEEVEP